MRGSPVIVLAVVLAVASRAEAQRASPPAEGALLFGGGVGAGVMSPHDCAGCARAGGLALDVAIGGFLTSRLAVMGDLFSVATEQHGVAFASTVATAAVQYWLLPALWLRGGAGMARLQVAGGPGTDSAFGFSAAVGHAILHDGRFELDLRARFAHGGYEGHGVSSLALLLAASWY